MQPRLRKSTLSASSSTSNSLFFFTALFILLVQLLCSRLPPLVYIRSTLQPSPLSPFTPSGTLHLSASPVLGCFLATTCPSQTTPFSTLDTTHESYASSPLLQCTLRTHARQPHSLHLVRHPQTPWHESPTQHTSLRQGHTPSRGHKRFLCKVGIMLHEEVFIEDVIGLVGAG
ncbi:hypothetical protein O0I10_012094 [Lichtheimia ornata]|uniref:Uncharacterized protein n=1 Tax=Lichtheimia ornata TaxID=688661 RepID=A0AAD7XTI3_9FUNG|nr:uncharacterized protein O0I10_012094 [Lichtheimia ornata]KAJ8652281.1 hypothetical protein O0I10_012094 [Lichtheimia ornata]